MATGATMPRDSILALAVVALLPLPAAAEEPRGLSVEAAVAQALARHPALAAGRQGVASAEARTAQAGTGWMPRVKAEVGYRATGPVPELSIDTGLTLPGQTAPIAITRELGTIHHAQALVSVGWRAWDFGARDAREEAARSQESAARADIEARAADLALAVRSAYASARFFAEVEAWAARSLEVAKATEARAQATLNAGLGADVHVAGATSRVVTLEAQLEEARAQGARSRAVLASLLGIEDGRGLALSDDLAALGRPGSGAPAAAHPSVQQLEAVEASLEAQRRSISKSGLPYLDVFGQFGVVYPETFVEDDGFGLSWAVGASLVWDFFDGGLRSAQAREVEARSAQVRAQKAAAEEQLSRARVDAETRARIAVASVAAGERRVKAAEVYLKAARGAKEAGAGTALEVRQAEDAVDAAKLSVLRARLEAALAEAGRRHALGVSVSEGGAR